MSNGVGNNTRAVGAKQAAAAIMRDAITIACRSVAYRRCSLHSRRRLVCLVIRAIYVLYWRDRTDLFRSSALGDLKVALLL